MDTPKVIDGKAVAAEVLEECKTEAKALQANGVTPGLAVVLVGDDPALGAGQLVCQPFADGHRICGKCVDHFRICRSL